MKKTIVLFLLTMCGILQYTTVNAQSTVQVYDLNPSITSDSLLSQSGMLQLNVNFKIQHIELADSVYYMLGTTSNAGDVAIIKGKMSFLNNIYYVSIGTNQYPFSNFETFNPIQLAITQFQLSHYISVKVKDQQGNLSNIISMQIN